MLRKVNVSGLLFPLLALFGFVVGARSAFASGSPTCTSTMTVPVGGDAYPECDGGCTVFLTPVDCLVKGVPEDPPVGSTGPVFCKCGLYQPDAHCDMTMTYTVVAGPNGTKKVVYTGTCNVGTCTNPASCQVNTINHYDVNGVLVSNSYSCGCR